MSNATPATTRSSHPVTYPPCPTWCIEEHEPEHPNDRLCRSTALYTPISGLEPVSLGQGKTWADGPWVLDEFAIEAAMQPHGHRMHVADGPSEGRRLFGPCVTVHNEALSLYLWLKPAEARQLAAALAAQADVIEGEAR